MLLVDILFFYLNVLEDMNTSINFYINKKETGAQVLFKFIK